MVKIWLENLLENTIQKKETEILETYKFTYQISGISDIEYEKAIAYTLYLLHAIGFIELRKNNEAVLKHEFVQFENLHLYKKLIVKNYTYPSIGGV